MQTRWKQRFQNFEKALLALRQMLDKKDIADDVIIDATLQRFEFTYELAWKTMKDYLHDEGCGF